MKLLDMTMHDGSRHFVSLPETSFFRKLKRHIAKLEGAVITNYLSDGILEVWIDFTYRGYAFTVNNQFGGYWLFVQDPSCPDGSLVEVAEHCATLLGRA